MCLKRCKIRFLKFKSCKMLEAQGGIVYFVCNLGFLCVGFAHRENMLCGLTNNPQRAKQKECRKTAFCCQWFRPQQPSCQTGCPLVFFPHQEVTNQAGTMSTEWLVGFSQGSVVLSLWLPPPSVKVPSPLWFSRLSSRDAVASLLGTSSTLASLVFSWQPYRGHESNWRIS